MTRRAPSRRVAHRTPPRKGDSIRGIIWAHRNGYPWADVNTLISKDGAPVAAHGTPYGLAQQGFLPKGDGRKVKHLPLTALEDLSTPDGYHIFEIATIFRVAAKWHVNIELEAKDDHRFMLGETWSALADAAKAAWGDDWQKHVNVKVLTNLSGGPQYARAVLQAAHAHGFTTMVLPRGLQRIKRFGGPAIDLNRGGRP